MGAETMGNGDGVVMTAPGGGAVGPRGPARGPGRRTLWQEARNIPNLLTFLRVLMIPAVLVLLDRGAPRDCYWAAWVYGLAGITDLLDGWLARRQGLVTVIGKFLDPLADKLLVTAVLVWLVPMGRVPAWAVVLLISREISITALRSIASSEGIVIAAGDDGKAKTALQMSGIIFLLLGYPYRFDYGLINFGLVDLVHVGRLLIYCSLVFSLASAVRYMGLFADALAAQERPPEAPPRAAAPAAPTAAASPPSSAPVVGS